MQYRICPFCEAHLDPGERCDCRDEEGAAPLQPERPQVKVPKAGLPLWPAKVKDGGVAYG